MATFQEVFDKMLERVEELSNKNEEYKKIIEDLEEQIARLEYENKVLKKSSKPKKCKQ
jgi:cell division protein FtsB